jgi:DNA-binding beta-propeller fold protein YncE
MKFTLQLVSAAALLGSLALSSQSFAADKLPYEPVTLIHNIAVPNVAAGDFDHFAVDLKRGHLFVSAEVNHSVEMFDLKTGAHLQSLSGFKTPHSLAFVPEKDELLVADGGDSALILVSGEDYHRIDRIQLIDGSATTHGDSPDAGYYDEANRLYYVGNGGISANMESSKISIYSVDQNKLIGDIDVATNNVEAMGIDNNTHRLFVNMRDHHEVGIFDLNTKQMIKTFTVDGMNRNTSLIVDPKSKRVLVAGRAPGILYVFDENGKQITQMSIIDVNDDMNFDPIQKRLYISGSQGLNVIHQDTPDTYTVMADIPTNGGKTSTYVPSVHQLYVIHPKTSIDGSGLLVFHVNN